MDIFEPWGEKQERAIFTKKPILLFGAGTQAGKTTVGALRMKLKMHEFCNPEDAFIITSPNYKTMMQSTLPPFLKLMEGFGKLDKKNDVFKMHNGGICYLRTETDPDSIIGITNVKHIWGDEAGKYRLYFWENIQARADFCGATIDLTTSPYALNWIYTDLIKKIRRGERHDIEFVQAASWENPYHSLHNEHKRIEKMASMDPRRFKALYGGEWTRMEGLVYDCWDDEINFIEPFQLPTGTKFYAGVDWGYTDPFVILVRAVTPEGMHYGVSEFYKTGLVSPEMIDVAKRLKTVWDIKTFFCDPSQPGHIEEFNRAGLSAIAADNDIRRGIDLHYELIKTGRYKEFRGSCPHLTDEREIYHYPEPQELRPDQNSKEMLPVGQHDHCFTGDTLVTTDKGQKRIDMVNPGDMVLTRNGFKPVLDQWCVGIREVVQTPWFRCTPEHQVYTLDRSFVRADSLLDSDRYITDGKWLNQSYSLARRIAYIVGRDTTVMAALAFMLSCGVITTGLFQKAFMFITKTATRLTTGLRTLMSLMQRSTYRSTPRLITRQIEKRVWHTLIKLEPKRRSGISQRMAWLGTINMHYRYGALRLADRLISNAFSVARRLRQTIFLAIGRSFALPTVSIKQGWPLVSIMNQGHAALAMPCSPSTSISEKSPARSVAQACSQQEPVYDLMVADEFEFFANGILVSNCSDCTRYLTLSLYRSHERKTPMVPGDRRRYKTRLDELKHSNRKLNHETWS